MALQQIRAETEKSYRKFFIECQEEELNPHGLIAYEQIPITSPVGRGYRSVFPDIVPVYPKTVTESHCKNCRPKGRPPTNQTP